ncbi:molecular chaperone Hsp90 [Blautia sp. Sow4_E7]|uniref:molecular chaperone Hsp90 n=1 Tax=Blautia sp. Sow4_E7 TaxID=3438749 RepID=UPI003F8E56C0
MGKTIQELTADLLAAPSACKEVKEAAQNYLDSVGKENEAEAAKAYVTELEADIMPIDGLISFAESDMGAKVFGADGAKNILAHAKDIKAAGAKYCDCPACAACEALLDKKGEILQ